MGNDEDNDLVYKLSVNCKFPSIADQINDQACLAWGMQFVNTVKKKSIS